MCYRYPELEASFSADLLGTRVGSRQTKVNDLLKVTEVPSFHCHLLYAFEIYHGPANARGVLRPEGSEAISHTQHGMFSSRACTGHWHSSLRIHNCRMPLLTFRRPTTRTSRRSWPSWWALRPGTQRASQPPPAPRRLSRDFPPCLSDSRGPVGAEGPSYGPQLWRTRCTEPS